MTTAQLIAKLQADKIYHTEVRQLAEVCKVLMEAVEKHHEIWSQNDLCHAECGELCRALSRAQKIVSGE